MLGSFIQILVLIQYFSFILTDIYLHNPRGSNNRLDEQTRERNNDNRMFDSQNNERGGYNVGNLYYLNGSTLQIEWTNQHSCNSKNANCDIILQYMCGDNIRDGTDTRTIPEVNEQCENNNCTSDYKYGMNEDYDYYQSCKRRIRNNGLFLADQVLRGKSAIYTRQNPNGQRYAYECTEERDYYPYWHPTKWIDIAVLTNDAKRCKYFLTESENVKSRWYCSVPKTYTGLIPINKEECEKINQAVWTESPSHNVDAPKCRETLFTRDNHLGNTIGGNPPIYNWKIPNRIHEKCVLRIRYNISTNDYDRFNTFQTDQNKPTNVNLNTKVGLTQDDANKRGYVLKNNPKVQIFSDLDFTLNLAINTAQYGRVFQDRSHVFAIRSINTDTDQKVFNLNVRGKRGNIVQVYPAVEYDFVPNKLEASINDVIHIQWTGSNKNPLNNAGQGLAGSDRSNIVLLTNRNYSKGNQQNIYSPLNLNGHYGVNYPLDLNSVNFLGLSKKDLITLATLRENQIGTGSDELDDVGTYFDLGPRKITNSSVVHYMCTRNNNLSNRDQKGQIISYDYEFVEDYIGWNGGKLEFKSGQIDVPEGALEDLSYFKIDIKKKENFRNSLTEEKVLKPNKLDETTLASDLIVINPISSDLKTPLNVNLRLKRALATGETYNLYRINNNNELMTKIDSKLNKNEISFKADQDGIYVVKYEKNYATLIGVLVSVGVVVLIVIFLALFLYNKPQYLKSLRYRVTNAKRSFNNQL